MASQLLENIVEIHENTGKYRKNRHHLFFLCLHLWEIRLADFQTCSDTLPDPAAVFYSFPWMPFCFRNQLIRYSEASNDLQWFCHPNWFNQKGLFCPSTNLLSTCRFESDEKKRVTLRGPVKANSMRRKGTEKKRKTGEVKWERVAEIPNFVEFSRILSHFPVSTYLLPSHLSA